jgi:hypothetical protein
VSNVIKLLDESQACGSVEGLLNEEEAHLVLSCTYAWAHFAFVYAENA